MPHPERLYVVFDIIEAVPEWKVILHRACERELLELNQTND